MIGLTGSHRTGKTTLAREFAESYGYDFVRTSASGVFEAMGLDPKVDYPFEVRLDVQRNILDLFTEQYRASESGIFVSDRTPIDLMAYTFADVQRSNVDEATGIALRQYMKDCIAVTNHFFSILMVVQPGIPLVEEAGKAPAALPYMEHIGHLVMGIVVSEEIEAAHYYIPRGMTSMERRVECMDVAIKRTQEKFVSHKRRMEESGSPMIFH